MSGALLAVIAIVGGTVHPGDGPPLEGATVLIEGQRIRAVGVGVQVPAGATVIDARGKVVTPGLIDAFSGLGLVEVSLEAATRDADAGGRHPIRAAHRVVDAFNPDSQVIPMQRAHGITTVVAVPTGGAISGQAAAFDLVVEGGPPEQALVAPAVAMVAHVGGEDGSSRGAQLLRLREVLDDARQYAANRAAFERNQFRRVAASRLDLEALQPVLAGRMPLAVSTARRADLHAVMRLAAEEKLRLVLVGAQEAWLSAEALAAARVPVVLDPSDAGPDDFDRRRARADAAAVLERAGVTVVLSTFDAHNVRKLRQWAGNAVRAGMSHAGALRAITAAPAAVFGLPDHGTLAPGKVANVVVWTGDPFEPTTRAEAVLVRGVPAPPAHRQRALFERYRRVPERAGVAR